MLSPKSRNGWSKGRPSGSHVSGSRSSRRSTPWCRRQARPARDASAGTDNRGRSCLSAGVSARLPLTHQERIDEGRLEIGDFSTAAPVEWIAFADDTPASLVTDRVRVVGLPPELLEAVTIDDPGFVAPVHIGGGDLPCRTGEFGR